MEEKLRSVLKPIYADLLSAITPPKDVVTFCMQWGKDFPVEQNTGILFVGKATNGWITKSKDPDILFGTTNQRVFARPDQMKWVHDAEGGAGYNSKNSAFWRVIKRVSKEMYKHDQWFEKVAWSNLYKVSFQKGNPNQRLKNAQKERCKKILSTEIQILSPRFVVFFTSGWEGVFVKFLIGDVKCNWTDSKWGTKGLIKVSTVNGITMICTQHPQGKNETAHVNKIIEVIKNTNMLRAVST